MKLDLIEMNSKQIFWSSFIFIFLLAFSIRYYPSTFGKINDPDAYFHLRNINDILENKSIPEYDELSMQGRYYSYPILFHSFFAFFTQLTGLPALTVFQFLPAFFGAMSCAVVFLIGRKLFNERIGLIAMLFLAITSIHIFRTFAFARPDGLSLFLIPLIVYVILEEQYPLVLLLSLGMALFHPLSTIFLLILLIFWIAIALLKKTDFKNNQKFILWIGITILVSIGSIAIWLGSIPLPLTNYVSKMAFESAELSNFSVLNILMFFSLTWFFGLVGAFRLKNNYFLKFWTILGMIFAIVGARMAIHLSIPLALLGAQQLEFVYEKIQPYQKTLFLILFFWIILITFSLLNVSKPYLTSSEENAMKFLNHIPEMKAFFQNGTADTHWLIFPIEK